MTEAATQAPGEQVTGGRTYGSRARLGLIVPTTNTVNESEWAQLVGGDVTFHTARMPLHGSGDDGGALPQVLLDAMAGLTPANLTALAYSCTAGSMVTPVESMPQAMSKVAEIPCTSTAAAIVAALAQLGVKKIAVASPYHDALNDQWRNFLTACDLEVTAIGGLGIGAGGPQEFTRLSSLSLEQVENHALAVGREAPAEALLLSCTDMPSLPLLDQLERTLGIPVVSSNTATLWRTLQLAGITPAIQGAGALLRGA